MRTKARTMIRVKLPGGWSDYSAENPDGPTTFVREINEEPSVFQISLTLYTGGEIPKPSCEDLVELAKKAGETMSVGDLVGTSSGKCAFGIFGTAMFKSKETPRTQIWYLSNGRDFILASHICPGNPKSEEIAEVHGMVNDLHLCKRSFWKVR